MQEQTYPHERDAFESLNVSKNSRFNQTKYGKISRDVLRILLRNEYENDLNSEERKDYELKLKWNEEFEYFSPEKKEKERHKIHKSYKKAKDEKIKGFMMQRVGNKFYHTQFELSNFLRYHCNVDKPFSFALNENEDMIIFADCNRFNKKAIKDVATVFETESNYNITHFEKRYPSSNKSGVRIEDLWRIKKDEYIGHYDGGADRTFHRGTMVGFIIHKNNV
jgi:hypothetical protein